MRKKALSHSAQTAQYFPEKKKTALVNVIVSAAAAECLGAMSLRDDALSFVHSCMPEPFKSSDTRPELFH